MYIVYIPSSMIAWEVDSVVWVMVLGNPLSRTIGGDEAARVPKIASISSYQGHVVRSLPDTLLASFTY